jgi:hypothetical protein
MQFLKKSILLTLILGKLKILYRNFNFFFYLTILFFSNKVRLSWMFTLSSVEFVIQLRLLIKNVLKQNFQQIQFHAQTRNIKDAL